MVGLAETGVPTGIHDDGRAAPRNSKLFEKKPQRTHTRARTFRVSLLFLRVLLPAVMSEYSAVQGVEISPLAVSAVLHAPSGGLSVCQRE